MRCTGRAKRGKPLAGKSREPAPAPTEIATETTACRVVSALRDTLGRQLERAEVEFWKDFEEIKSSTVRRVLRGVVQGPEGEIAVHVKLFRAARLSDRARDAIRGVRALREFELLRGARQRGLPCVEPLAAGERELADGPQSFLVTRSVEGTSMARGRFTPEQAARAGELLRLAHDAGLLARDLHPGNVLETPGGELMLLDLTSAALSAPLGLEERARALAFFCAGLDGNVRDPMARPLLASYGAAPQCVRLAIRDGLRLRHRNLSAFGRRATRPCRHTAIERRPRSPRLSLHLPAAAHHDRARQLFADPPPPLKAGRRGSVHCDDELVLKERTAAAARRLFRAAYWLDFAEVPCPRPVALWTWRGRGRVVAERLPGPNLLEEVRGGLSESEAVAAARELGVAVGRLHAHGLRNRDMKLENLVRDPESGAVAMVDLDGIHRKTPTDRRGQAADLGRLLAAYREVGEPGGKRVYLAFLRGYIFARKCLLRRPKIRYLLRLTRERASARASRSGSIPSGSPGSAAASATRAGESTAG